MKYGFALILSFMFSGLCFAQAPGDRIEDKSPSPDHGSIAVPSVNIPAVFEKINKHAPATWTTREGKKSGAAVRVGKTSDGRTCTIGIYQDRLNNNSSRTLTVRVSIVKPGVPAIEAFNPNLSEKTIQADFVVTPNGQSQVRETSSLKVSTEILKASTSETSLATSVKTSYPKDNLKRRDFIKDVSVEFQGGSIRSAIAKRQPGGEEIDCKVP